MVRAVTRRALAFANGSAIAGRTFRNARANAIQSPRRPMTCPPAGPLSTGSSAVSRLSLVGSSSNGPQAEPNAKPKRQPATRRAVPANAASTEAIKISGGTSPPEVDLTTRERHV